jgi:hypothetical protein
MMARRWRYTDAELAKVLDLTRRNPGKWTHAVNLDERKFGRSETVQKFDA